MRTDLESSRASYSDNSNPNAEIGFVVFYPFQFYVFKNVYKHLSNKSEFIVDLGAFFPVEQPGRLVESIIKLLRENGVYFRVFRYDDYFYPARGEKFFSKYAALVSLWKRGCLNFEFNQAKKKIHLTYGAGKDLITYGTWKRFFDLILAYGERDHKYFSIYTNSEIVGNPKFDDWFNNEFDEEFLKKIKSGLDKNKKTVLYLPTHSDLSSIDDLAGELKNVARNYNVITKLHYYTAHEEADRVEKLRHKEMVLLGDDADLLPLFKITDVVLSDNSSAIFDAILADKPLILTDFLSDEFLDVDHKNLKQYRRGTAGALTYSGSIEQRIKKEKAVLTIKAGADLGEAIKTALEDSDVFKKSREKIRNAIFAFQDGRCGQRAADAINEFVSQKALPERPLFYYLLNQYKSEAPPEPDISIKNLEKNFLFSVILPVFPRTDINHFKICLLSLVKQKFSLGAFEIIVLNMAGEEMTQLVTDHFKNDAKMNSIKLLSVNAPVSAAFPDGVRLALNKADGGYVAFALPSCFYRSDWLDKLGSQYLHNQDITGVGGYVTATEKILNVFYEYYLLDLLKKLNIKTRANFNKNSISIKSSFFYQNPAGCGSNVSYKKKFLDSLDFSLFAPFPEIFEQELKYIAMSNGRKMSFISYPAYEMERMSFLRFLQRNFIEGIGFCMLYLKDPSLQKYYKYTLFFPLRLVVGFILDDFNNFRLAPVIFLGSVFRYFGRIWAILSYFYFKLYHSGH